jgi:MoxR-like ATPase
VPDTIDEEKRGTELHEKARAVIHEVRKVIIGKDAVIAKVLLAILSQGHILLEDVPGVGKTTMAVALASAMNLHYNRIQFTPEVMPADVVGYSVLDRASGTLSFKPGPALCNLLLVDEINRASSKTQSALLEAMEENAVTVDGVTHGIAPPYTVIATQNPAGSAGTQLLPESQLDRFMTRLSLGYPAMEDEVSILKSRRIEDPLKTVKHVANREDIREMQRQAGAVHVDDDLYAYIAQLASATREDGRLRMGASPRASLALLSMSRSAAWFAGRDYMVPADIDAVIFDVLEHRIAVNPQNAAEGETVHSVIEDIMKRAPRPQLLPGKAAEGRRSFGA